MAKRLFIKDKVHYSLDKVNCFERAIVNQLKYKNKHYGDLFIMLIKLYQFYFWQPNEDQRRVLVELSERVLDVEYQNVFPVNLYSIKDCLDKGYLPIIGGDLYYLFYSDHYKIDSWPHWFVITGCDIDRGLYYLSDDLQYTHIDREYKDICLTNKIINTINKKYLSLYDKKWSCFFLRISKVNTINELLRNILLLYFKFDTNNKDSYPQTKLISNLFEVRNNNLDLTVFEKLKRKVINMNKYRTVFINEIEKYMGLFECEEGIISELKNHNLKLEKTWEQYVTLNILNCLKGYNTPLVLNDEIVELESNVRKILIKLYDFLLCKNNNVSNTICEKFNEMSIVENDCDGVVRLSDNQIIFDFDKGREYNWWFEDNAPKVVLAREVSCDCDFKVTTKIYIDEAFTQKNFQAGIFLRFADNALFCALDSHGLFVLDEIGKINKSSRFIFSNEVQITLEKHENILLGRINDNKATEVYIEWYAEFNECIDIGFSCKTWGESGSLNLKFFEYNTEVV